MKTLKKVLASVMVICMMMSVVTGYASAAEQKNNITYVTENGGEEKFKQVAAGLHHSLGLTVDGKVYAWGRNSDGQLGDGTSVDKRSPVFIMDNVKYIAASEYQSYAITNNDDLYVWGNNSYRELGDGTTADKLIPTKLMSNIKNVVGGYRFSMALTNNGDVYVWGTNSYGALGMGLNNYTLSVPTKVFEDVKDIAAQTNISLALKNNGDLYYWGHIYTSRTDIYPRQYTPAMVMQNIKEIACGNTSIYAISNNDELYGMGYLNGVLIERTPMLTPIKILDNVHEISAYNHILCLDNDHNLFVWGLNTSYQLGNGNATNTTFTSKLMENIQNVATGVAHSLAVTETGELYVWGTNSYGQLGLEYVPINSSVSIPIKSVVSSEDLTPRLEFSNEQVTIAVNRTMYIRGKVYNSKTKDATWSSSNESVATVDNYGNVTALAVGTTEVTMTTGDGLTDTCLVIVTEADVTEPDIALLSLLLEEGDGTQLSVSRLLGDNLNIMWTSTDESVVTVNDMGYITAISDGLIRIYAETEDETFFINVRVISGDPDEELPEEYQLAVDLHIEEIAQLYLNDEDGIVWYSMDDSVAEVDGDGKVTAVSEGLAIIQADFDGQTYIFYIRVRE